MFPKIYLAIDNCFASKRWTEPRKWLQIVQESGIYCVEASADNEFDPLYSPPDAMLSWIADVQIASAQTGVKVVNLYSGHGTYATLGLGHPDQRIRDHMQQHWLEPMIRSAAALGAGLGFFCHAFPQSVLREPESYREAEADLCSRLAQLTRFAQAIGVGLSLEQMYSPHQIPWTISGTQHLLQEVYRSGNAPLYLTLDTGHQVGQRNFLLPQHAQVEALVEAIREKQPIPDVWLGLLDLPDVIDGPERADQIMAEIAQRPYMFATEPDGDLYTWLRQLGCYSTIIHLQQTDGLSSAHRPFTEKYNRGGIVSPERVLRALYDSYTLAEPAHYPPRCDTIYLTLEIFSGTAERPENSLLNVRESAAYWRQFVPEDGLTLDQLVN